MMLQAINPSQYDERIIAQVARRADVREAARQARMSPVEFVRKNLEQASPGLSGLGFSFSDTANSIMSLYTQYKSAGQTPPPSPPVVYQAPAAAATAPAQKAPWYSNMTVILPLVAGIGVALALLMRRKKRA